MKNKDTAETAAAQTAADAGAVYSARELTEAAGTVFNTSPDIVSAALRVAGVKQATVADAEKIIKEFAGKEIK